MASPEDNPETMSDFAKHDRIMAQPTIMNSRLDDHDARLARVEQSHDCEDSSSTPHQQPRQNGGGSDLHDRRNAPCLLKINFTHFVSESNPLMWINNCESYFRGMRTMEEEKVWLVSLHLDGAASQWFYALERDLGTIS